LVAFAKAIFDDMFELQNYYLARKVWPLDDATGLCFDGLVANTSSDLGEEIFCKGIEATFSELRMGTSER